jgi:hypothetical protein
MNKGGSVVVVVVEVEVELSLSLSLLLMSAATGGATTVTVEGKGAGMVSPPILTIRFLGLALKSLEEDWLTSSFCVMLFLKWYLIA